MKAGFLDLLIDTFGWVCGKTFLFYFGITIGAAMAFIALPAGASLGGSGLSLLPERLYSLPLWGGVALHFAAIFVSSLWWVRSEKVGSTSWTVVTILESAVITGGISYGSSYGSLAMAVTWTVLASFVVAVVAGMRVFRRWQEGRWISNTDMIESANLARRAELTRHFGTVSTGARDLGLFD